MSSTCPTCGQPRSNVGACACAPAADPFPLDEFVPELAPPIRAAPPAAPPEPPAAPAPPTPDLPAASVLEIARARLSAASTPATASTPASQGSADALARAEPAELGPRTPPYRSRTRIPVGIRLVIGRRRKPARTPAPSAEIQSFPHESADAPPAGLPPGIPEARPAAPVPAPPTEPAPASPAVTAPPRRSHPALEAQARLFDEPLAG